MAESLNIYEKLVAVRSVITALTKDKLSPQNYWYVTSSNVLSAVRGLLDEQNLLLEVRVLSHNLLDKWRPDAKGQGDHMTEMELEFVWRNADNPQESIVCPWYAQGVDSHEKGIGKALTYATKYFLLSWFLIPTDADDPDAHGQEAANSSSSRSRPPVAKAPAKQGSPPARQPAKAADKQAATAAPAAKAGPAKEPMSVEEVVDMATFKAAVRRLGINKATLNKAQKDANLADYALDQLNLDALRVIYGIALVTATQKQA